MVQRCGLEAPPRPNAKGRPPSGDLRVVVRDGVVAEARTAGLTHDVVYSIHGAGGQVWVGRQTGGVTRLRLTGDEIEATSFTHRDGLAQDSVFAIHRARDSAVWAGTLTGGVSVLKDGRFATYDTRSGLPSNTVSSGPELTDNRPAMRSASSLAMARPSPLP